MSNKFNPRLDGLDRSTIHNINHEWEDSEGKRDDCTDVPNSISHQGEEEFEHSGEGYAADLVRHQGPATSEE